MISNTLADTNTLSCDTLQAVQYRSPMGSIDPFLGRVKSRDYNCADFAAEVWEYLTGEQARYLVEDWHIESRSRLQRINSPANPCIIIMYAKRIVPHVGIFVRGKVLHLTDVGVEFQPVYTATRSYRNHRFYVPK